MREGQIKRPKSLVVRIFLLCILAPIWTGAVSASVISTIVGTTGDGPSAIVVNAAGNIFTANSSADTVTKLTQSGVSTSFSSGGDQPMSIVLDSAGNIYIPHYNSDTVVKLDSNGNLLNIYSVGETPTDIAIDSAGNIYVLNSNDDSVSKITPGDFVTTLGTTPPMSQPLAITVDSAGNVYTANYATNNVSKIAPDGTSSVLGTTGNGPYDIAVDSAGNVYTANNSSNNVSKITPSGTSSILGTTGSSPMSIAIDASGNIYTANMFSSNVTKITPDGISSVYGTTGEYPTALTFDTTGNIFVANGQGTNTVSKLSNVADPVLAKSLSVTFDTQGGSLIAKATTINGGNVTNPGTPTRDGFTFTGWNTAADGSGTAITFPYHHTNSSDFTLYAQWRANVSTTPTTAPPTTAVTPLIAEELPSTGGDLAPWPLLLVAAGLALITLRRHAHTR